MVKNESGFTLIEIIVVLVLIGIVAVMVAMGFVTGIQGYIFARDMAPISQKANLAMSRLSRELLEISTITSATANSMSFSNIYGDRAIALVGTQIKINDSATIPDPNNGNGYVLIDNVDPLNGGLNFLTYYNGANSWSLVDDIKLLSSIKINLVVIQTYGTTAFSTAINPRNTGNYNAPII